MIQIIISSHLLTVTLEGFPPTFLVTGRLDLFLSDTAHNLTKMWAIEVAAGLIVCEGISHGDDAV